MSDTYEYAPWWLKPNISGCHRCTAPPRFDKALCVIERLSAKALHTQAETKLVVPYYLAILHEKWDLSNAQEQPKGCPFCIQCIVDAFIANNICVNVTLASTPQHIKDFVLGLGRKE